MSETVIELPVLVTRVDGKEEVLVIQTYLVGTEVPFLCRMRTLENWNFKLDEESKILEIQSRVDGSRKQIKMIDTEGGHYGVILETRKKDESSIFFLENAEGEMCLYKAVRKVHKINHHKKKEQLISAFRSAGCMNPDLVDTINRVVNDC